MDIVKVLTLVSYQLPYYLCIILLSIFIINYVDKSYQANLIYIILVVLFDNMSHYIVTSFLKIDSFSDFFLFNQLKTITGEGDFLTTSTLIALSFTMIYFISSYYLFSIREFK